MEEEEDEDPEDEERYSFEDLVRALEEFQLHYHHLDVPEDFVVSPSTMQGTQHRARGERVQYTLSNEMMHWLASKGDGGWAKEYLGDEEKNNKIWSEDLLGMRLGRYVRDVRCGEIAARDLPERKDALDRLGFDWGEGNATLNVKIDSLLVALHHYLKLEGDSLIPVDYVIPSDNSWPKVIHGFPLGEQLHEIKRMDDWVDREHPELAVILSLFVKRWLEFD